MLAWLFVPNAFALDCLWGVYTTNLEYGQTVPPDLVIVGGHTFSEITGVPVLELVDADGATVPVDIDAQPFTLEITPREPLGPGDYVVRSSEPWELGVAFTVADLPQAPPLDAPENLSADRERSRSDWGTSKGIDVRFDPVDGASYYEIELAEREDFLDAQRVVETWEGSYVGDGLCGPNVLDYDHGTEHFVRARAVDLVGDASPWSEVARVAPGGLLPTLPGCSVRPGTPLGGPLAALALTLSLFGWRRRA
ncbi:MAG: hypothetical protein AAF602_09045 [Myxococcota bacterium]